MAAAPPRPTRSRGRSARLSVLKVGQPTGVWRTLSSVRPLPRRGRWQEHRTVTGPSFPGTRARFLRAPGAARPRPPARAPPRTSRSPSATAHARSAPHRGVRSRHPFSCAWARAPAGPYDGGRWRCSPAAWGGSPWSSGLRVRRRRRSGFRSGYPGGCRED